MGLGLEAETTLALRIPRPTDLDYLKAESDHAQSLEYLNQRWCRGWALMEDGDHRHSLSPAALRMVFKYAIFAVV